MARSESFPSDDMIVLAMLLEGDGSRLAEDIASTLRRLGFNITPQKMVGQLKRLCAEDSPMVEATDGGWPAQLKSYRVTRFGDCQVGNHFPRVRGLRRR